jgi:hypothetical protein
VKKWIILITLVVALIVAVVTTTTVLAGKPSTVGPNVVMEAGSDTFSVPAVSGGHTVVAVNATAPVVHVSFTVYTQNMQAGDTLYVNVTYVDKETPTNWAGRIVYLMTSADTGTTKTIEFDCAKRSDTDYAFGLYAFNNGGHGGYSVYYNYTMTYPKS